MQRQTIREIAKFGAGLITGDFLIGYAVVASFLSYASFHFANKEKA